MAQAQMIRLADIRRDDRARATQMRVSTNAETVTEYANALRAGAVFPPIELVPAGKGRYYIVDGYHRVEAHIALKRTVIRAKVLETLEGHTPRNSAICHALKANRAHGLRLTPGDQTKRARAALMMAVMRAMTDRKIAREIGVGHQTVHRARANLVREQLIPHPLTGEFFDSVCPPTYAAQDKFNAAFPEGADQFQKVCRYLWKLNAFEPANWRMAVELEDDAAFGSVIHAGLVHGEVVSFLPFDNPIVDGLPGQHGEFMETPDAPNKPITKAMREQWAEWAAARKITAAEKRVYARAGPEGAEVVAQFMGLMAVPDLVPDLWALLEGIKPVVELDPYPDF